MTITGRNRRNRRKHRMCKMTDDGVPKRKPSNNLGKIFLGALALPLMGTYVLILTLGYLVFVPFVVLMSLGMIVPEVLYLGVVVLPVLFWRKLVFGEEFSFPEFIFTEMLVEGLKSMWRSYTLNVGRIFFR